jgi:hypothetical protein
MIEDWTGFEDAQTAIFGEYVDTESLQPVLVLAEHFRRDAADGEDVTYRCHGQAACLAGAMRGCQFQGCAPHPSKGGQSRPAAALVISRAPRKLGHYRTKDQLAASQRHLTEWVPIATARANLKRDHADICRH